MSMVSELMKEVKDMRKEQGSYIEQITALRRENLEMRKRMEVLENSVEKLERKDRQRNIVMTGLELKTGKPQELKEEVKECLDKYLELESKITSVKKLSEKSCIVELENLQEKEKIMKEKAKLRRVKGLKIFINNDLTVREQKIQKYIREEAKKQREIGKRVKVGYRRLKVGNEEWVWSDKDDKLVKEGEKKGGIHSSKN